MGAASPGHPEHLRGGILGGKKRKTSKNRDGVCPNRLICQSCWQTLEVSREPTSRYESRDATLFCSQEKTQEVILAQILRNSPTSPALAPASQPWLGEGPGSPGDPAAGAGHPHPTCRVANALVFVWFPLCRKPCSISTHLKVYKRSHQSQV